MNTRKLICITLAITLVLNSFLHMPSIKAAAYSGDGTESSPYLIGTVEEFNAIPIYSYDHYRLTNDIDFGNTEIARKLSFGGTFDGNNFTLSNFTIECKDDSIHKYYNVGLFGFIGDAEVMNLTIDNASIEYNSGMHNVGILAGTASNSKISSVTVKNSSVVGERSRLSRGYGESIYNPDLMYFSGIIGSANNSELTSLKLIDSSVGNEGVYGAGGITAYANNTIIDQCSTENSHVLSYTESGLLCAWMSSGCTISNSNAIGGSVRSVNGNSGGLVAYGRDSDILRSYSENVTINGYKAGGIVAYFNRGSVKESYAKSIIESKWAGGIMGWGFSSTIENCYTQCDLQGVDSYGIAAYYGFEIMVRHCYSASAMSFNPVNGGVFDSEYYYPDSNISNYFNSDFVTPKIETNNGRTTDEMYQQSTYIDWDFDTIWTIDEGNDYPRLAFELLN